MTPQTIPPATAASLVREVLQGLQGWLDLTGLGRQSIRVPKEHLTVWKRHLEDVLHRVEER
jgi:hypothetical protein